MAKNRSTVFLGFLDEAITTKYQNATDHTTNKLGGNPVSKTRSSKSQLDYN